MNCPLSFMLNKIKFFRFSYAMKKNQRALERPNRLYRSSGRWKRAADTTV